MNTLIHNRFDVVVRDASTEEIIGKHTGYNIILNTFWAQFLRTDNRSTLSYLQYGSGTAIPTATDTALGTRVGGKAVTDVAVDLSNFDATGVVKRTCKIRIEASESNGTTISEVGMATGASSGLVTKALIKDQNGNALQITKTDAVIIDIYSTFFVTVPKSLASGVITIYKNENFLKWLLCNQTLNVACKFVDNTEYLYGRFAVGGSAPVTAALTFNTSLKKITATIPNLAAGSGNIGGLVCLEAPNGVVTNYPNDQTPSPLITKEVVGAGDGVKTKFTTKFGRIINDGSAKLYVNDVEVSADFVYGGMGSLEQVGPYIRNTGVKNTQQYITGQDIYENVSIGNKNIPITSVTVYGNGTSVWACDTIDGVYTSIDLAYGTLNIPEAHQLKKYWCTANSGWFTGFNSSKIATLTHVEASSPPAAGATVAATYRSACIPKDSNSVFNNISVSLTFAEYTP